MSEPLTLDRFENFEKKIFKQLDDHTKRFDDQDAILTAAKDTLDDIAEKVDTIEKLLWQGERLREIEDRVIKIAEVVGDASLAHPFTRPIGT